MTTAIDNANQVMNTRLMQEFTKRYQERLSEQVIDAAQGNTSKISFSQMVDLMADSMREIGFSESEINEITALKNDELINRHFSNIENSIVDENVFNVHVNSDTGNKFEEAYANFIKATTPKSTFEELQIAGQSIYDANSFFADVGNGIYNIKTNKGLIQKTIEYNKLLSEAKHDLALAGATSKEATLEAEMTAYNKVSKGSDNIVPVTKERLWQRNVEKGTSATGTLQATKAAYDIYGGGKSFVSGFGDLQTLEEIYQAGEIKQDEYELQKHYINLKISQGFFTSAKGVADVGAYISYRIASKASKETAEKVGRFAPVAGNILGVMSGINGVVQKGFQAHEALISGNGGRAAMYAVSASLDVVVVALNSIAAVLDLIPGIGTVASFVIDIVATIIDIFSSLIAGFAELVDTRTDEQKLQQAFDKLVNSKEFKQQVKSMSEAFVDQGYDVFKYIIDTKGADLDTPSESTRDLVAAHTELVNLTEQAKKKTADLRIAMIDNSFKNTTLEGGALNDYIRLVGGGDKTIDGKAGNDVLIGGLDRQLLVGGEGDDYLDGREGADSYESGPGDDTVAIQPSVDIFAVDSEGTDTILVHENDAVNLSMRLVAKTTEKKDVYDSLVAGKKTIHNGDPISNHIIETDSIVVDLSQKKALVGLPAEFKITDIDSYDFNNEGFFNNQGYPKWKEQLQGLMKYHNLKPSYQYVLSNRTGSFDRSAQRTSTYQEITDFLNRLNAYSGDISFAALDKSTRYMTSEWQKALLELVKRRSSVTFDEVKQAMSTFLNEITVFDTSNNGMDGETFFVKFNKDKIKLVPSRFEELGLLLNAISEATMKTARKMVDVRSSELQGKEFWLLASYKDVSYMTDGTYIYERKIQAWGPEYKRSEFDISSISESTALVQKYTPVINTNLKGKYEPSIKSVAAGEFDPEQRMLAELYLRFKDTAITGYENILIKDVDSAKFDKIYLYNGDNKANSDLAVQLTGDNSSNYLSMNESVSHKKMNYLSGKEGDDTLHVQRYADLQQELKGKLSLDGGIDEDTAVLSYSLKDKSKTLSSFDLSISSDSSKDSDIAAKNIESFVFKTDFNANGGIIDLSNYSVTRSEQASLDGIGFTVDSKIKNLEIKTSRKSDIINIINIGEYGHIINTGGSDILNLTNLNYADGVTVNLNAGYVKGLTDNGPKVSLDNINNVFASRGNDNLLGNDNANFLYTEGGKDIALGGRGNDVLSTSTGDHTLIGGEGQDRYILNTGKTKKMQSVSLSRDNDGRYKISNQIASGNLLAAFYIPQREVLFGALGNPTSNVKVMMGERDVTKHFTVQLKSSNEVVIEYSSFEPLHLKNNETVDLKVEYYVASNDLATARVRDLDQGNEIVFNNVDSLDKISPELTDEGEFILRDRDSGAIIYRDLHWFDLIKQGVTSLQTLSDDFAIRFSKLSFTKSNSVVEGQDISSWLMKSFAGYELSNPRGVWDLDLDLNSNPHARGGRANDTIKVNRGGVDVNGGDGDNIYNVSNDPWKRKATTKLISGKGNNTINIGVDASFPVEIYNADGGNGDVLNINGVSTSAIKIIQNSSISSKRYQIIINGKPAVHLNENDVEKITVQDGDKTWIVSDVNKFLHQSTTQGAPKYYWSEYLNKDGQLGLSFDAYRPQDISVKIYKENDMTKIEFISGATTLYNGVMAKHSQNELLINTIAKDMATVYAAGISFQQGRINLRSDDMAAWLEDLLFDKKRTTASGYQLRFDNGRAVVNLMSSAEVSRHNTSTAKLTSDMAAFDAANSDMVGSRRHTDSSTAIQPIVTNVN